MSTQPLVSVLMTAYNREAYIAESIQSIMDSTYQNWELIIVDDQSKDNTVQIAKSYAKKDNRIRVYINDINLGDYPNRNKAASYAKGKYIKYVDSDDVIYPFCLETMVLYMERNPEIGMGLTCRGIEQDSNSPYPIVLSPHEFYTRSFIKKEALHLCAPIFAIIKSSTFKELNGFMKSRFFCDQELWLRYAQKNTVLQLPSGLFWMRTDSDGHQERKIEGKQKHINDIKRFNIEKHFALSNESPLTTRNKIRLKFIFLLSWIRYSFKLLKDTNFQSFVSLNTLYFKGQY